MYYQFNEWRDFFVQVRRGQTWKEDDMVSKHILHVNATVGFFKWWNKLCTISVVKEKNQFSDAKLEMFGGNLPVYKIIAMSHCLKSTEVYSWSLKWLR